MDYEASYSKMKSLAEKYRKSGFQDLNEATTRLRMINDILFDCLDWDKSDCIAEDRFDGTFIDYGLHHKSGLKLIVEAKKEGISFELPVGSTQKTCPIEYFRRDYPKVFSAIEQALEYCQNRGVALGAISNGHQILAFLGSRTDGIPPIKGRVAVFESFEAMEEDFLTLWNCLSIQGASTRHLAMLLREGPSQPIPDKLSSKILNYPVFRVRNALQSYLKILGDLAIEDLARRPENEEEFLQECYSESGALSQYALVSKGILQSRYSTLYQESVGEPVMSPATTKSGVAPEFVVDSMARRPILLVGDIGAGKTTFIRHLIKVSAKEILSDAVVLFVDLGVNPTFDTELHPFLAGEIGRQLREDYGIEIDSRNFIHGVYNIELDRFEKGLYADLRSEDPSEFRRQQVKFLEDKVSNVPEHLRRCLEHIRKGHQRQIVIFLDNLDQRSEQFQQNAFLLGQSIAERWPALVYISLRPETFTQSKSRGTIGAYHVRAFTISPPRIDRVVEKRLRYGKLLLERQGSELFTPGIGFNVQDLIDYLDILIESFSNSDSIREMIENLCGGNVRLALDFIRIFIGSGHVNTKEVLDIYHASGTYTIAIHHFLNAIIYGDYQHFDSSLSEIKNLFDIATPDGKEHFLVPILLAHIDKKSQSDPASGEGYVDGAGLFDFAQSHGFTTDQIVIGLDKSVRFKLIESHDKVDATGEDAHVENFYRVTTIGSYYYRRLISTFAYIDAMIVDTPIIDSEFRAAIGPAQNINERLARAEQFKAYLDDQWLPLQAGGTEFQWLDCSSALQAEIDRVQNRRT